MSQKNKEKDDISIGNTSKIQPLISSQESKSRAMENFFRMRIIPRAWVWTNFPKFHPQPSSLCKKNRRKFDENQPISPPVRVAVANKMGRFFFVAEEWREEPRFHPLEVMISSGDEVWQAPTTSDHALGFFQASFWVYTMKATWKPKHEKKSRDVNECKFGTKKMKFAKPKKQHDHISIAFFFHWTGFLLRITLPKTKPLSFRC